MFFSFGYTYCSAVLSSGEKMAYCHFKYFLSETMAKIAIEEAATLK